MDNVRSVLEARGIKQVWLAREIGMDPTLLNHILMGRRKAPTDFMRKVAKALRVKQSALLRPAPTEEAA